MSAIFSGYSEFGRVLADFLAREASVRGAVVSDDQGDAVDLAYDPARTTELEIQILGAQLDRAAGRVTRWVHAAGKGSCEILIEASHGRLCCAFLGGVSDKAGGREGPLESAYVLAVIAEAATGDDDARAAEAERVLAGFRALRRDIETLLRT